MTRFKQFYFLMAGMIGILLTTSWIGATNNSVSPNAISDLQDGLVLHMPLEYDPSGGIVDQSTYANHGTCTNCPAHTTDAKVGSYAYEFDRGEYFEISNTDGTELEPQTFTLAFWVKVLDAVGTDTLLGLCGADAIPTSYQGYRFIYDQEQNAVRFQLGHRPTGSNMNGMHTNVKAAEEIALNQWYHLVGRWDGENLGIFVNGRLSNENYFKQMDGDTNPIIYDCAVRSLFVGSGPFYSENPSNARHANILLDDFRMYDRALTDAEINELACGADGDCAAGSRPCPKQLGVCAASVQTCASGAWPGCDQTTYQTWNAAYESKELSCTDGLDNDCDGKTDRDDSDCTLIRASRDAGIAPLSIFFDAINDYGWSFIEQSEFSWNFGDGSPEFKGYMAAHVYELDDADPQTTYTVTLTVKQNGAVIATDTRQITVSPFTGRTICASSSGNFSNCPSTATADHFTDLGSAWAEVDTNTRLVLRRGDEWVSDVGYTKLRIPGPVIIAAYGQGDRPKITFTNQDQPTFLAQASPDWRFVDLHIEGGSANNGVGFGTNCLTSGGDCRDLLILRTHIEDNTANVLVPGVKDGFFIFDSTFENMGNYLSYNYYGEDIAFVNVTAHEATSHFYRIGAPERILVTGNDISDDGTVGSDRDTLTIRGSGYYSRYLLVSNNLFRKPVWQVQIGSQNLNSVGPFRYMIVEGNTFAPYPGQSGFGIGLILDGYDGNIRNNVFIDSEYAVDIGERDTFDDSRRIGIYNNTVFLSPETRRSGFLRLDADANPEDIRVMNNLLTGDAGMWTVYRGENIDLSEVESDHNIWHIPSYLSFFGHDLETWQSTYGQETNSLTVDPQLMSTNQSSPDFLFLSPDSPAIDAGISVPVFADFVDQYRPWDGDKDGVALWDIGAHEYKTTFRLYLPFTNR